MLKSNAISHGLTGQVGRRAALAVTLSALFAAPAWADAKEDALRTYLSERIPSYLNIKFDEMNYRDFPVSGGGRLSVEGVVTVAEDLLWPEQDNHGRPTYPAMEAAFAEAGHHPVVLKAALKRQRLDNAFGPAIREMKVLNTVGLRDTFTAELFYQETVSGISIIRGDVNYPTDIGLPASLQQYRFYVVGEESFNTLLNQLLATAQTLGN